MPLNLDYFYGSEAEQYSFYRIPKALFTDEHYKSVTVEAKVLYGLLLDRMGLSMRNGWVDEGQRVYIYFTLEDAMEQMNCGKDKAVKLFKTLDAATGIGLIERKKQGQGRPTRIYVKNFILPSARGQSGPERGGQPAPGPDAERKPQPGPGPSHADPQTSGKPKSELRQDAEVGASKIPPPDFQLDTAVQTSEKPQSGQRENRSQDFGKADPNKTDRNKTEESKTEESETDTPAPPNEGTEKNKTNPPHKSISSIPPPLPADSGLGARRQRQRIRMRMDEIDSCRGVIQGNIGYASLLAEHPLDRDLLDGYVELMVEACCSRREYTRISGQEIPTDMVKNRLLKLTREHIGYVMESMQKNTTQVRNIKAYTLAALYNAPVTMGQYYTSQVSHDMANYAYA